MANTVNLDTLFGGLKPTRAGGGHQSKSLRLTDNNGKEYVMRALKKSASRFLQSVAFKDQYVEKEFEKTYAESFLLDFYTTSHPYTPFVVGDLAEKVGVYHSNPILYYILKQNALGKFNENFGDELYMVEERPDDSQKELESFGKPNAIISTDDLLKKLQKSEKNRVDEESYIRARLFDMLIGDWDRHADQWRWSVFKNQESIIYKPIPRDRDQAFVKADGTLLSLILNIPGGCSGDCLPSGSVIGGKNLGILGSMVDKDDLKTYIQVFQEGISVLVDSLSKQMATGDSESKMGKSIENLSKTIDNLELLTRQMNGIMGASGKSINQSMSSLSAILKNIETKNLIIYLYCFCTL